MLDPDLVAALSAAKYLPAAEIRSALAEPERIAPAVLDVLSRAGVDGELEESEVNLLFWGLHVLAAAQDTRVFRPLLTLLRHDGETLDALLGDAVTETLAPILNSVFDGDGDPLIALLLDTTVDDSVRNELFAALAVATHTGQVSRDDAYELLVRFDDKRAAVEGDIAWMGWEETIGILGFRDLVPRIEAARADGRIEADVSDAPWLRKVLHEAETNPDDVSRFDPVRHGTLDDPIAALSWTAEDFRQPVRNPFKHVGRNDPCPCGSGKKFKKCCLDKPPV